MRGRVWVDDWVEVGVVSAEKEATTGVRSRVLPPIVEGRDKRTRRGHERAPRRSSARRAAEVGGVVGVV